MGVLDYCPGLLTLEGDLWVSWITASCYLLVRPWKEIYGCPELLVLNYSLSGNLWCPELLSELLALIYGCPELLWKFVGVLNYSPNLWVS